MLELCNSILSVLSRLNKYCFLKHIINQNCSIQHTLSYCVSNDTLT